MCTHNIVLDYSIRTFYVEGTDGKPHILDLYMKYLAVILSYPQHNGNSLSHFHCNGVNTDPVYSMSRNFFLHNLGSYLSN